MRIENLGPNVDEWNSKTGNGSSTYDVCATHGRMLEANPHAFDRQLQPYNGDPQGTDGWGGDVEHPDYTEGDYRCVLCRRVLGGRD